MGGVTYSLQNISPVFLMLLFRNSISAASDRLNIFKGEVKAKNKVPYTSLHSTYIHIVSQVFKAQEH